MTRAILNKMLSSPYNASNATYPDTLDMTSGAYVAALAASSSCFYL